MNIQEKRQLVYKSIELLPAQIEAGWFLMKEIKLNSSFIKDIDKIVVCGMGGSNLGFDFVRHALGDKISIPIIINAGYDLPNFVDNKTLVILSSYSGGTEEVLSCYKKVLKQRLKYFIITSGGSLAKKINKTQGLIFDTGFNPSGEPRWGLGYSIGSFIGLLNKINVLKITEDYFLASNITLQKHELIKNIKDIKSKALVIIGSGHLSGNAHILNNQLNETAKNLAWYMQIPDLNHHFLEGLSFPKNLAKKNIAVLLLNSDYYPTKIKKRFDITAKVFNKQGLKTLIIKSDAKNILADSLSTLQLGSYLCYDISVGNKVDPLVVPWVDYFKQQLSN